MQTKPKSNSIITSVYDEERNVIKFTVLGQGDVELDLNKVAESNMRRAAIHGWNQRIPDAAAIGRADAEGEIIPETERTRMKFERMNDLCRHYESGTEEWNRKGTGGGGGGKSLTIEAMAEVRGIEYDEAAALAQRHADTMYKGDLKKALAFFRTGAKIAEAMRQIKLARMAAPAVNPDDVLAEMQDAE